MAIRCWKGVRRIGRFQSEESFTEEWASGEAMTVEEAVEYRLEEPNV